MSEAFLPLVLEERLLLIETRYVREILGSVQVTRVPHASLRLPGVFAHGHRALPLLDLSPLLDLPTDRREPRLRTIVLQYDQETVGASADEVLEIVRIERAGIQPAHVWPGAYSKGEAQVRGRAATVVDVERLIADCLPEAG